MTSGQMRWERIWPSDSTASIFKNPIPFLWWTTSPDGPNAQKQSYYRGFADAITEQLLFPRYDTQIAWTSYSNYSVVLENCIHIATESCCGNYFFPWIYKLTSHIYVSTKAISLLLFLYDAPKLSSCFNFLITKDNKVSYTVSQNWLEIKYLCSTQLWPFAACCILWKIFRT